MNVSQKTCTFGQLKDRQAARHIRVQDWTIISDGYSGAIHLCNASSWNRRGYTNASDWHFDCIK
jgi:hypothetical protein